MYALDKIKTFLILILNLKVKIEIKNILHIRSIHNQYQFFISFQNIYLYLENSDTYNWFFFDTLYFPRSLLRFYIYI